jgi:transposase InsO family protein
MRGRHVQSAAGLPRRRGVFHPATGPNQVWSWDISKLKGPEKWTYFYLYVVLDIFSRYAVGWMVAKRESAALVPTPPERARALVLICGTYGHPLDV